MGHPLIIGYWMVAGIIYKFIYMPRDRNKSGQSGCVLFPSPHHLPCKGSRHCHSWEQPCVFSVFPGFQAGQHWDAGSSNIIQEHHSSKLHQTAECFRNFRCWTLQEFWDSPKCKRPSGRAMTPFVESSRCEAAVRNETKVMTVPEGWHPPVPPNLRRYDWSPRVYVCIIYTHRNQLP